MDQEEEAEEVRGEVKAVILFGDVEEMIQQNDIYKMPRRKKEPYARWKSSEKRTKEHRRFDLEAEPG